MQEPAGARSQVSQQWARTHAQPVRHPLSLSKGQRDGGRWFQPSRCRGRVALAVRCCCAFLCLVPWGFGPFPSLATSQRSVPCVPFPTASQHVPFQVGQNWELLLATKIPDVPVKCQGNTRSVLPKIKSSNQLIFTALPPLPPLFLEPMVEKLQLANL